MKVTIFLLIISSLDTFINFAICEDSILNDPIATKTYPKKFKRLQILNPRKFLKVGWQNENRNNNLNKRDIRKERYTFFPVIYSQAPHESFFQPEHHPEPKVRVKKVLPDYLFTLSRGKRSVTKDEVNESKNVTRRRKNRNKKKNKKIKDGDKLERSRTRNSTRKNKKSKLRSKHRENNSTPELKYTVKRNRHLRKGKHVKKNRLMDAKILQQAQNGGRSQRKKKVLRERRGDTRRLIASRDANIYDYPYVVSIQKSGEHWCTGALANPQLVVTSANCVWKADHLSRLRIRAGSRHADRGGQIAKIQEVMKNPKWSIRGKPDNDLALLLLDRKIKFSDKVHAVDLPNRAMTPSFEDAWVTSWGAERRDGIYENTQFTLQVYHAKVLDRDKCNNVTNRFGVRVSENFFCLTQSGRRAPCTRDTGAPAVSDGVLWGVASWGLRKQCGTERFPAMFSYLASPSNMDFITNATHRLMSEQRFNPFPDRFAIKHATTPIDLGPRNDYA